MARRLTLEETLKYLIAWREYEDEDALTLIVDSTKGLVSYFARKYLGKGLTFDELISAGYEGLINAINKFNYLEREIEGFKAYVSTSIDNAMKREIKKYNKHSHVLNFSEPLGQNKDGDELTIQDILGTDAEQLMQDVISEMKIDIVREALQCLTSRERQIIFLRYGLDEVHRKTQEEISEIFGCTKQAISL